MNVTRTIFTRFLSDDNELVVQTTYSSMTLKIESCCGSLLLFALSNNLEIYMIPFETISFSLSQCFRPRYLL